jgi:hypothetical protein
MRFCKLLTNAYKHDYFFKFNGEQYRVHSIVRLTEYGKLYLGAFKHEAILKEQFTFDNGRLFWKYEFMSSTLNAGVTNVSTDEAPEKIIEYVIVPSNDDYFLQEEFGIQAPNYKSGIKETKMDYEIAEVRRGWFIFILVFIGASIFKDWYVQLIIRVIASIFFALYRQIYVNIHTTYSNPDNYDVSKRKYETLYSVKEQDKNE